MGIKAQAYTECSFCLWFSSYSSECTISTIMHFSNTNLLNHDYCNILRTRILIVSGSIYSYWRYISGDMKICQYLRFHTTICLRFHILRTSAFRRLLDNPWPILLYHNIWKQENSSFLGYETGALAKTGLRIWNVQSFYMNRIYRVIFASVQL